MYYIRILHYCNLLCCKHYLNKLLQKCDRLLRDHRRLEVKPPQQMLPVFALCSGDDATNQLTEDVVVLAIVRTPVPLRLVKTVAEAVLLVQPRKS